MAMDARDHLPTEWQNSASTDLDRLATGDAFDVVNREDAGVAMAVARAKPAIVAAVDLVAARLEHGGRLFYVGAGTSGRLGVLDAAECPPTFQSDPSQMIALVAGGPAAITNAIEGAEDSADAARAMLAERRLSDGDVVLAIAASGTTPFAHGAISAARASGAASIFLACVPFEAAPDEADVSIRVVTGPEVIAGSTRMKAGTATKLVLNTLSTLAMVKLGKVYGNLMVDVNTHGNAKLWRRGIGLVGVLTGLAHTDAEARLIEADGQVKVAVVMERLRIDAHAARAMLGAASGHLRRVIDEPATHGQ